MKKIILAGIGLAISLSSLSQLKESNGLTKTARQPKSAGLTNTATPQTDYPYTAIPFTSVKLTDQFWLPRIKTNHSVTIPASFERCDNTGRIKNFIMAAEKKGKFCTTYTFDDTDIYKTIEGAALIKFP